MTIQCLLLVDLVDLVDLIDSDFTDSDATEEDKNASAVRRAARAAESADKQKARAETRATNKAANKAAKSISSADTRSHRSSDGPSGTNPDPAAKANKDTNPFNAESVEEDEHKSKEAAKSISSADTRSHS